MNRKIDSIVKQAKRSGKRRRVLPCKVAVCDDTAVKKSALRVLGPYKEKDGVRLIVVEGETRKSLKYPTVEQAEQIKLQLLGEISKQREYTVGELLAEYEQSLISDRGRAEYAVRDECARLRSLLRVEEPIRALTLERATQLYRATTERPSRTGKPLSADFLYFVLKAARRFCGYCVERGLLPTNPFAKIRRPGRLAAGKPQLTADEARRFLTTALDMAREKHVGAIAVALQLALGLRSSELLARRVRDLDEGGSVLLIPNGKTHNARRRPEVPEFLRPHLRELTRDKAPDAYLFGTRPTGQPLLTNWLIRAVHRVCERAGVPKVCAHSLRGLHATLALRQGVSSQAVATALGHGSFAVTARHYADPTQLLNTRVRTVLNALHSDAPEPSSEADPVPDLAKTLQGALSDRQVEHLIHLLTIAQPIKPQPDRDPN